MTPLHHPFVRIAVAVIGANLALARAGETSLFNGNDLQGWREPVGTWSVIGSVAPDPAKPKAFVTTPGTGVFINIGRSPSLVSKAEFGDAEIHVEFCVPKDSNSGIYVMGRYEVQIFDSFGKNEIAVHDCGAIYERWDTARGKGNEGYEGHTPKVNASKPPGEWQSLDITFRAPRFDAAGRKTDNAKFIKVMHNGVVIHENVEMTGPTRGGRSPEAPSGPVLLQGDHGPVAFRNLRVVTPSQP
jgi:hypothetical protein